MVARWRYSMTRTVSIQRRKQRSCCWWTTNIINLHCRDLDNVKIITVWHRKSVVLRLFKNSNFVIGTPSIYGGLTRSFTLLSLYCSLKWIDRRVVMLRNFLGTASNFPFFKCFTCYCGTLRNFIKLSIFLGHLYQFWLWNNRFFQSFDSLQLCQIYCFYNV